MSAPLTPFELSKSRENAEALILHAGRVLDDPKLPAHVRRHWQDTLVDARRVLNSLLQTNA